MTRILLADDHPMIGSATEMLLRGTGYQLVGLARSGADALAQIDHLKPEITILDVHMPDGTGIDVRRRLRLDGSGSRVILLTAGIDDQQLRAAEKLEPNGIVLKTGDPGLLLDCLDEVLLGRRWIDPEIARRLKRLNETPSSPQLTPRERDLVRLVRQGLKNREIARELNVTEGTVKVYLHALFEKLGVKNRTDLAMRASEFGILDSAR